MEGTCGLTSRSCGDGELVVEWKRVRFMYLGRGVCNFALRFGRLSVNRTRCEKMADIGI